VSRRRVAVLAAVAVSVSVLVAGCTQDAGPKPSPLPSTTKTASPSSTAPTPPVMPAEAKGTSAKSAELFARHYVDLVNYSMHSGDTEDLAGSSGPKCKVCSGLVKDIRTTYDRGGRYEDGSWGVRSARAQGAVSRDRAFVTVAVRINAGREFPSADASPKLTKSSVGNLDLILSRRSGRWIVQSLAAT
jgi:uncharacterized protein DUF6318